MKQIQESLTPDEVKHIIKEAADLKKH